MRMNGDFLLTNSNIQTTDGDVKQIEYFTKNYNVNENKFKGDKFLLINKINKTLYYEN